MDKTGVERLLLVVPKKYRNDLKAFCHEGTSGHLGVTKTKDIFSRHLFWPQCYKEIEDYVRSCDRCQRVGKPFDKKKAPMKIVPVIQAACLFQDKCRCLWTFASHSKWKKISVDCDVPII
ncbi:hypothetical protein JTE90_013438 [Oedothorax gibbosus]|uniref:RNA-directed DNA polymerase n=1 Tax=Oedothorax gibbosus TaxID=931172 RepID=A0AAV6TT82_9ARAC|nr:hypothetical protein JTE90_013438 [Oedothorax gibbosus]